MNIIIRNLKMPSLWFIILVLQCTNEWVYVHFFWFTFQCISIEKGKNIKRFSVEPVFVALDSIIAENNAIILFFSQTNLLVLFVNNEVINEKHGFLILFVLTKSFIKYICMILCCCIHIVHCKFMSIPAMM